MFKAIIFDVDGTLSETEDIHRRAFNQAFMESGLSWYWNCPDYRLLLRVTGGKERIRHFIEQYDPDRPQTDDIDRFIRNIHATKTKRYTEMIAKGEAQLRPGVRDFIDGAISKGIRLAIATTTSPANVEALLDSNYTGRSPFEVICAGDDVPRKKPAPDIYLAALEMLDLEAADCIAIEDSRNGLLSAITAGLPTIVTPGVYTNDQHFDEAVLVADDLSRLNLAAIFANTRIDAEAPQHTGIGSGFDPAVGIVR
jgi:HAD superfamily hydrolase (TIGR01509 family)